jgi:hypothetical protein
VYFQSKVSHPNHHTVVNAPSKNQSNPLIGDDFNMFPSKLSQRNVTEALCILQCYREIRRIWVRDNELCTEWCRWILWILDNSNYGTFVNDSRFFGFPNCRDMNIDGFKWEISWIGKSNSLVRKPKKSIWSSYPPPREIKPGIVRRFAIAFKGDGCRDLDSSEINSVQSFAFPIFV